MMGELRENLESELNKIVGEASHAASHGYERVHTSKSGSDSDPPIENEKPGGYEERIEVCNHKNTCNAITAEHVRAKSQELELEKAKRRAQLQQRKRRKSSHNFDGGAYAPPYKKNRFRHLQSVLPSKFLLGGNIRDPLNLASLSDARISAELNTTPQSSPLPVHGEIPVCIPKNPQDPLGLTTRTPDHPEDIMAGVRKNSCSKKNRHKKKLARKRTESENLEKEREKKASTTKDNIFQFGNYSHYYGYRAVDQGDPRLWVLKKEYFEGKDVLDVGCNSGHVTISVARDFEPRRIHGIDIDYSLISLARKNIKHYIIRDPENKSVVFPKSMPMIYGAMQPPPGPWDSTVNQFPYNVSFSHENYALTSDSLLESVIPQYDVILCLSVTKWIHLNYGDAGLKRFFKRIFRHLRDDGIFILEPQPWGSYAKKKKLTEKIHQVYLSIKFHPDQFKDFLLNEVGFESFESLGTPAHSSKGFQRPLLLFKKPILKTVTI